MNGLYGKPQVIFRNSFPASHKTTFSDCPQTGCALYLKNKHEPSIYVSWKHQQTDYDVFFRCRKKTFSDRSAAFLKNRKEHCIEMTFRNLYLAIEKMNRLSARPL